MVIRSWVTWMAVAVLTVVVSGCSSAVKKEYVASDNPDVNECFSSCKSVRLQCRARGQDQYKICRSNHDLLVGRYNQCVRTGSKVCQRPPSCPPPETRHCTSMYDGCYQGCGGVIRTTKGDESH